MKKSLLALAALTAFAGVASAQSSVTLFGIVDLGLRSTKTGSVSQKLMSQDGIASSRLGFRGVEDLGGGLRAGFWLEAGLNPDIGGTTTVSATSVNAAATATSPTVSQLFNRRSTVSLLGGFGEVRLGRDYTPSFWNYTVFDPFGTNGVAAMSQAVGQLGSGAVTFVRTNNSVGYFLPAMGGLYGQAMVSAGENLVGQKYTGFRIGFAGGPVNVAAAMGKTEQTHTMLDDYTDANVGASFKMGTFTLMGQYSKRDYRTLDEKTVLLGGVLAVGAGNLKASFVKTDGATPAADLKILGLGYDHSLSKRTALYGTYAKIDRTSPAADTTAYEFGVRHAF